MSWLAAVLLAIQIAASPQAPALTGRVLHADLPVPGATITAKRSDKTVVISADETGTFRFASLEPGAWTITVEMRGFGTVTREVTIPATEPEIAIALTMKKYEEIVGASAVKSQWPATPKVAPGNVPAKPDDDAPEILAGSVTNGAATIFAQNRGMGNNRPRPPSQYTGLFSAALGNSAWNAKPYSFGGSTTPAPDYADGQFGFTFGGPLRIPGVVKYGPMTRLNITHGVQHTANTQAALVPTLAERRGDLSTRAGIVIPPALIAPQATALLALYPLPTGSTRTGANFERPVVGETTNDGVQVSVNHNLTVRTQLGAIVNYQRTRNTAANIFDFTDRTRASSFAGDFFWSRRFSTRLQMRANYRLTSSNTESTPFFANRTNVSGDAGISGNDQSPLNWGPPTIQFPDFADLRSASYQRSSSSSHGAGTEALVRRGRHNLTIGGDFKINNVELRTQPDPRGTLTFTGGITGDAFADFLLGLPATSAIAFGNASARLRGSTYDAYFRDDFRYSAGLTFDLGLRWEYETPYGERDSRMANLEAAPGFSAVTIAIGSPLIKKDARGFEPRLGVSWRPILTSSLVIKGGYGLYRNLGVYQSIGTLLAQQPPFANTFRLQTSAATPLTLANPFPSSIPASTTFAVDPGFTTALLHSWQVTVQRELPASLTIVAGYFGDRGTHLGQAFLPNTYAPGAANPCASCPSGFTFLTSGGTSTRNAGQLIVRRRLYAGFTAGVTYTLAKATDNASTFSNSTVSPASLAVAQDWRNLEAERGPSSFDQRHLVQIEAQYTTGVGLKGGTLVDGWLGRLYKDWTITSTLNTGSGLPLTPIYFVSVPGSGVVGVRPSLTGKSIAPVEKGSYANPAAFTAPTAGTWGTAGRNSIRGPRTFSFDLTVARAFRPHKRITIEWRLAATNILNRVTYSTIDRVISSPQFGQPTGANQMRRIQSYASFKF